MNAAQRAKLERAGFRVGSTDEFLGLTDVESKLINFRLGLADLLKSRRVKSGLRHPQFAKLLKTTTSMAANIEAAGPEIPLELLLRAVIAAGATPQEIATAFCPRN